MENLKKDFAKLAAASGKDDPTLSEVQVRRFFLTKQLKVQVKNNVHTIQYTYSIVSHSLTKNKSI